MWIDRWPTKKRKEKNNGNLGWGLMEIDRIENNEKKTKNFYDPLFIGITTSSPVSSLDWSLQRDEVPRTSLITTFYRLLSVTVVCPK